MLKKILQIDARYFFLLFFLGVFSDAFLFGMYMKTPIQLVMAFCGALGTDILLNYIRHRKWIFPLSGLVSSCGSFILLASPYFWTFFVVGFTSMWSKHFITYRGRHIFNPVNFGALMCLLYLQDYAQGGAMTWSGNYFMLPYLLLMGTILVYQARSIVICFSYLASFFLIDRLFLSQFLPVNIASFASPPFMLFVFFMISDPKTTPREWKRQILFALSIALVEAWFKYQRILNGGILALAAVSFVVNFLYPFVCDLIKNRGLEKTLATA